MRRVAILGATGSIGTQALQVIRRHPEQLSVAGLVGYSNQARLESCSADWPDAPKFLFAQEPDEVEQFLVSDAVDIVLVALGGAVALRPTLAAIRAGKTIALATKEVLVAAGELVMPAAQSAGVEILPVDSEHSAIFQALRGYRSDDVERLILTASGGPFRGKSQEDLREVTPEIALKHPTWTMGAKITIDSATLMNKALETIEAKWLFDVSMSQIEVVVHPQSVVHSIAILKNGSALGQLGFPNMELPIQIALMHPEIIPSKLKPWNPVLTGPLTFEDVDRSTFPALDLAALAMEKGGTAPAFFNAANEQAVSDFLQGRRSFLGIARVVEQALLAYHAEEASLASILRADALARETIATMIS